MKLTIIGIILTLGLFLVGCGAKAEETKAPLGDAAQAFTEGGDLKAFVTGDWCIVDPDAGVMKSRYYTIKGDGTFECGGNNGEWKSTGTWQVTGTNVALRYETMKGKSWEDYRAEYKKDEEGGGQVSVQRALFYDGLYKEMEGLTQLWVDTDKKHLTFSDPNAPVIQPGEGEIPNIEALMSRNTKLERTGPAKS